MKWVLVLAVLSSGCALFRTRAKEAEICQPPPTGALLCFYRNQQAGHWDNVDVVVDGKSIGLLENDHWVEVPVPAGDHLARVYAAGHEGPAGAADAIVRDGQLLVFHVGMEVSSGFSSVAELTLDEVTAPRARAEISSDCRKMELGAR